MRQNSKFPTNNTPFNMASRNGFTWATIFAVVAVCFITIAKAKGDDDPDYIDMDCDPAFNHRYKDCPDGYCCVRDEFLPTFVYCRRIGKQSEACATTMTESNCPCASCLYCKANIEGQFHSLYGKCTPVSNCNETTTPPP